MSRHPPERPDGWADLAAGRRPPRRGAGSCRAGSGRGFRGRGGAAEVVARGSPASLWALDGIAREGAAALDCDGDVAGGD